MNFDEWKNSIVDIATRRISYRKNMSETDILELSFVLSDYLEDGIRILRKWRKLRDYENDEFLKGEHDSGLIKYLENCYIANGRSAFDTYSSGGVSSSMKRTPESILKSTCEQVM